MSNKFNDIISTGIPADHVQALEREIMDLKSQLQVSNGFEIYFNLSCVYYYIVH